MKCPKCGGKTRLRDISHTPENEVYRIRGCDDCDHEFATIEYEIEFNKKARKEFWKYHRKTLAWKESKKNAQM